MTFALEQGGHARAGAFIPYTTSLSPSIVVMTDPSSSQYGTPWEHSPEPEKLVILLSPRLLANHSIHGVAVPAEPHIRPPVPQVVLSFSMLWRGDSQKVTMRYRAGCHFVSFSPKEDSEERRTQQTLFFLVLPYLAMLGNTTGGAKNYAGRKCNLYPMRIAP
ncbi:hypothetical protein TURU_064227 [Turdus rufiventris]|nr:hypothetical protein TURU_064227 [Turdus rufiventris]